MHGLFDISQPSFFLILTSMYFHAHPIEAINFIMIIVIKERIVEMVLLVVKERVRQMQVARSG